MQVGLLRKETPGAGLNVVTNTMPLHLHIKAEAMKARVRSTYRVGKGWEHNSAPDFPRGHIARLTKSSNTLRLTQVTWMSSLQN